MANHPHREKRMRRREMRIEDIPFCKCTTPRQDGAARALARVALAILGSLGFALGVALVGKRLSDLF